MSTRLPFTLIDAQGNFNEGIQKDLKLDTETSPLAVVSIIGAQSSGKSTLLNRMFHTEFKEMDAKKGRQRTTKGIRLAKYSREGHCIILIDTEGSDGKERQGNEKFALRTAVFAMAISNIVIINMMCTDVGRESGGGWLLLRMACEAMQRFKPAHQVRLLFVLRDKTNSPLEALESQILDEMKKIIKAQGKARLFDLFKIDVKATSPYLIKGEREKFKAEVRELREWIISRAIRTSKCLPTSSLTTFAKKIWVDVKKDKNLDVPSYEIMIAKELCDRIVKKQRDIFEKDKSWLRIKEKVKKSGSTVRGFGKNVSDLISTRLSRYDDEAKKFDKTVREERRKRLIKDLLEIIEPIYCCLVERMRRKTLEDFGNVALAQLRKDDTLKGVQVQAFIDQFHHQVQDAYIRRSNWSHASRQQDALRSDIQALKKLIEEVKAQVDKLRKPERKKTWTKIAIIIGTFGFRLMVHAGLAAVGIPSLPPIPWS